ncbi:DMT family transporter [Streptomyces sp. NPDC055103]
MSPIAGTARHPTTETDTTTAATERPAPARKLARGAGLGVFLALLATVVWSGSFVATRDMADSVPPVQAVFWRWVIALLAVAPFAARPFLRQWRTIRRHLGFVALASLFGVALYNTLVHQAGLTTSASNMGMIMAASPVIMAVYTRLGGERLGARRILGMLTAALGVLLLVGKGSSGDGSPSTSPSTSPSATCGCSPRPSPSPRTAPCSGASPPRSTDSPSSSPPSCSAP